MTLNFSILKSIRMARDVLRGCPSEKIMIRVQITRCGRVNWSVLLWAIGVPIPIVIIVALMRGCQ